MIKDKLKLDSQIFQGDGNIVSDMDGEKVIMNIYKGKYYNLHTIGGVIWDLIEKPIFIHELINKLIKIYNVENKECEEQVLSFLETLSTEGLIQIKDTSKS
ncbi:lasso peptide biosynthesis PqqD family chaperone [Neobacillus sp. 179-C4.2 HS]|jgi:hypothetical protein|uniref:Lasso peptide biosynthesis PqqD family chaperone n=1 Tax=Neobacillus driksii TaxID=3035913 RepID=A0ABV4Z0M1_9BACI|nr:lasso peptide biosynthesis PqqD family chaperone [Neobacillus sp. 179.-C4.2 HS]MDP5195998.1 lasso peptide biosynthesis PqqD family chaperone [Neobacillus sp. 179.-C4.2 HS]